MNHAVAREQMINHQVRAWDVLDPRILDTMAAVPRERFVPAGFEAVAFADTTIPLAHGEHMLEPCLEGRLLQSLDLERTDNVLHIGTGSGYVTACLASLVARVVSVEIHADLLEAARERLGAISRKANVELVHADIREARLNGEFSAILATGSVAAYSGAWDSWLKPDGRLVVVEGTGSLMEACRITRTGDRGRRRESLFDTRIRPLRGFEAPERFEF